MKHLIRYTTYRLLTFCLIFCLLGFGNNSSAQHYDLGPDSMKIFSLNREGLNLMNLGKYEEGMSLYIKANSIKENPVSDYLIGHVYTLKNIFDSGIYYGLRATQLDPGFTSTYQDLFDAYYSSGRWQDMIDVYDKVVKANPGVSLEPQMQVGRSSLQAAFWSKIVLFLLCLALVIGLLLPVMKPSEATEQFFTDNKSLRTSEIIIVSGTISCLLWAIFFAMAGWIRSFNPPIVAFDFVNYIRGNIYERDGYESFAMYILMFLNIILVQVITPVVLKLKSNRTAYLGFFITGLLISIFYFFSVGFFPAMSAFDPKNIITPALLVLLTVGLYYAYHKMKPVAFLVIAIVASFSGFIDLGPTSTTDLSFVLCPALRLMHGSTIPETYFQYDLFLSFLALAWMKMGLLLDNFPYLGQVSFFLFFAGSFLFGEKYFKTKGLSVIFLVAIILVRFYTIWSDNPSIFQVSPLRLDLWLILLLIINKKGINHWLFGTVLGLLILFHRNLGLIYFGGYVELLATLFIIGVVTLAQEKSLNAKSILELFIKQFKSQMVNLGIILSSVILCFVLFHEFFSKSALAYRKLGVGMMPISKLSFYWYVPIIVSALFALLVYYRRQLSEKYLSIAFFIIFLVIGNSMYFFGRSHENNILNISGILVFALFIFFDILIFLSPKNEAEIVTSNLQKNKKGQITTEVANKKNLLTRYNVALVLPVLFVFFVGYYYSERISDKVKTQYTNLVEKNVIFPFPDMGIDTAGVRAVTHNSDKVYILDFWNDFYYYYYGNYVPQGFYSPCQSWIFSKDFSVFLQSLLDKGYYVVYDQLGFTRYLDYFPRLDYNECGRKGRMNAIRKIAVPKLLPANQAAILHVAMADSLSNNGVEHEYDYPKMQNEFTIEMIVKPSGPQIANATILNNLSRYSGLKGLTVQGNNNVPNNYVFGFSNGTGGMPNATFNLEDNQWSYVVITLGKNLIKIYVNGKQVGSVDAGPLPYVNSNSCFVIGNNIDYDHHFRGFIREVKVTNGNINDEDIVRNTGLIFANIGK